MPGPIACRIGYHGLNVQFCGSRADQQGPGAVPPDFGAVGNIVSADGRIAQEDEDEAAEEQFEGDAE